jgi:serine/threonine protein kinase
MDSILRPPEGKEVFPETESELDGRYRLRHALARISGGGFVYAAEHKLTRRKCAVKLLSGNAPESMRLRLRREIDALACVQGPGVVELLDAGESDDKLYIVLELLEGRTLAGLLAAKGRLSIEAAVKLGLELSDALSRCHERGVVHRDVKPSNVFVTLDDHVKLLDFGIAKIAEQSSEPQQKLTQENSILGTPEYMAPEALLTSLDVDWRVDQYALGVTLYECLAGSVPFEGQYGEVLMKRSSGVPRPLRELRSEVPDRLAQAVDRALRFAADERFDDLVELRAELASCLEAPENVSLLGLHPPERAAGSEKAALPDAPPVRFASVPARRRHARAPYITLARVKPENSPPLDGRIEEVSESGFQFVADRILPAGQSVGVRFALPISGKIVEASATARWSRSARGGAATGFEFSTLSEDAKDEIRRYVSIMCP